MGATLPIDSSGRKAILAAAVVVFGVFAFYAARWGFANAVASQAELVEISDWAAEMAPGDPQTRFTNAVLLDATFEPANAVRSLAEFEAATALSPYNYLLWIELGRAYERNGEGERAIAAFRRALKLAPNYSTTQWSLGNALFRQGNADEAVPLILRAAESDVRYADAAAMTLWQMFEGDIAVVQGALGASPKVRARLVPILAREKQFDAAMEIWSGLDAASNKQEYVELGRGFYSQLADARRYKDALAVISQVSNGALANHSVEKLFNGDFEIREQTDFRSAFEWRIADGKEPVVGLSEGQKRNGNYSFLVRFPQGSTEFNAISQVVAVDPNARYEFEIFYRSELDTAAAIRWEIVDAASGQRLSVTEPMGPSTEWARASAHLAVPAASDGIEIRLIKECQPVNCPVSGDVFFDDAAIRPLNR